MAMSLAVSIIGHGPRHVKHFHKGKRNRPPVFVQNLHFLPQAPPLLPRRAAPKGGEAALFGPASLARAGAAWYNPRSGEKPRSDRDLFFAIVNRGIWVNTGRL